MPIPSSPLVSQPLDIQAVALIQKSNFDTYLVQKFKTAILKNSGGDISKRWFVEWWQQCENSEKLERKRIWLPTKPKNANYRFELAEKICFEINTKLRGAGVSELSQNRQTDRPKPPTVAEMLQKAINNKELRKKTIQTYSSHSKLFCKFLESKKIKRIESVTPELAKEYLSFNRSEYDKTYKNKINHLKALFNELIILKEISNNPFEGLKGTYNDTDSNFNHPFSDYEKNLIESHLRAKNKELYLFTRFLFFGFIRPQELINIRVKDIDTRNRTIKVSGVIAKTKKAGVIPIIPPLMQLIIESGYLSNPPDFYLFGKGLKPCSEKCPINYPNFQHRKALEELNIYRPNITVLYSWKHTGNIFAYLAGVDIKVIQQINRHSSLLTTEIYLKKLGLFLDQKIYNASW